MKELLMTAAFAAIPISLYAMAAYLMFKRIPGWGWFLFVVFLVTGSMRWTVT